MKFYSFEKLNKNIVSETDTDGTYFLIDLFERSVINNNDIKNAVYYVEQDYSCRMDNICSKLYEGSTGYVEELTVLNHILNPFSVEKGDYILYTKNPNDFSQSLFKKDFNELSDSEKEIVKDRYENYAQYTKRDQLKISKGLFDAYKE
jgi:hypothetical protein